MALLFRCILCGRPDTGNPNLVPSIRVRLDGHNVSLDPNGKREPLCRQCVAGLNDTREEQGLEPFPVAAGAYEAAEA
ncbi:MAG: hypothetical protein OXC11_08665 [Rhodospirillales bacterium]|nr:hypothetical protein [Rhodospirillales bacterium]